MTPQPLIAVSNVPASSRWYCDVLGLCSGHGGDEYEQLLDGQQLVLQLHAWDVHEHPHLGDPRSLPLGNGVLLWFQTQEIDSAYARAESQNVDLLEPLKFNPLAGHREFWMRDPDGYVVVVAGSAIDAAQATH